MSFVNICLGIWFFMTVLSFYFALKNMGLAHYNQKEMDFLRKQNQTLNEDCMRLADMVNQARHAPPKPFVKERKTSHWDEIE